MSGEPRIIAKFSDTAGLKDGFRRRVSEIGISFDILDEICNFPLRYSSKILAPSNMKNIGPMSLDSMIGELAVDLWMVENPEKLERMRRRIESKTTGRPTRPTMLTASEQSLIKFNLTRRHMKKLAKLASIGRKKIPQWKRQKIARGASRARWQRAALKEAIARKRKKEEQPCPTSDMPASQPTAKALKISKSG